MEPKHGILQHFLSSYCKCSLQKALPYVLALKGFQLVGDFVLQS